MTPPAPRVGVFICHCGKNIGGYIDVPMLVEYAKGLPNVAYAEHNLYTCSEDGLQSIKKAIKAHKLNRVVVASCTPRTHAKLFQGACEEAGINKYLFEFVNIRDQCSWVHMKEKDKATQKAKDLVRMGVAKASLLEPRTELEIDVLPVSLVLGGGVAGMTAAINLANQGITVHLVEKNKDLGGMLKNLETIYPTDVKAKDILRPLIDATKKNPKIKVHLGTSLRELTGYIGNFEAKLDGEILKVGTIIVATGADVLRPEGMFGYGSNPKVMTQLEFEKVLGNGKALPDKVVMIQCVGARMPSRTYCSRTCCMVAIKNAKELRNRNPGAQVHILHRDINAAGTHNELYYDEAQAKGVMFSRYTLEEPPEVLENGKGTVVRYYHPTLGKTFELQADCVVLSTPMVPNPDNIDLNKLLKVPLSQEGFFLEAHMKLRPVEFATDGIYLAGSAKWPSSIAEAVSQGYAAAAKAAAPMKSKRIKAEAITAEVDATKCSGCGLCEMVCPYRAISLKDKGNAKVAEVNAVLCKGCGTCAVTCPSRAIVQYGFTDRQLLAQVEAAVKIDCPQEAVNIVGFCCNWCSYAGADMAGVSRFQYPANLRIIRTMCSGRVDPMWILKAFLEGADGVFVSGCHPGDCHYMTGNNYTKERMEQLKEMLSKSGIDPRRLRLEWVSASEGNKFAELVTEFTNEIKALGPSPIRTIRERRRASVKET